MLLLLFLLLLRIAALLLLLTYCVRGAHTLISRASPHLDCSRRSRLAIYVNPLQHMHTHAPTWVLVRFGLFLFHLIRGGLCVLYMR